MHWDEFIAWWCNDEIEKIKKLGVFEHKQIIVFQQQFDMLQSLLGQRPVMLLHGDLQPAHILVDVQTEQVLAFLDFADAQPGDALFDIAVLTLWDHELTDLLLEEYDGIVNNEETQHVISLYRLLRLLAEIPWLMHRGFNHMAARNIVALQDIFRTFI